MDRLHYLYGITLPRKISKKLDNNFLYRTTTKEMLENWYCKDAFQSDGQPVQYNPDTLYPIYAPRYLRQMIPSTLLEVAPLFKHTAAIAAIQWLSKLLYLSDVDIHHFDGETFTGNVDGESFNFCFPLTTISYSANTLVPTAAANPQLLRQTAAIIPFPDSRENDSDWQGSVIPSYAESQARFLLWCWRQSCEELGRRTEAPQHCFIVRITGNTPSDVMIRTVLSDPQKEDMLMKRLCKSVARAKTAGTDLAATPTVREQATWYEQKQQNEEEAYKTDSKDLYDLITDYMTLVTIRKTKKAEAKRIKEQEECIAISLAALTSKDARTGTVDDPLAKLTYTVSHSQKNYRCATISAALVREFFPEHIDCIVTNEYPRGRITIEAD